jgi:type IV secretory pathway protease TraF
MKHVLFATVAVLGLATAIPAFADMGDTPERLNSADSLPSGFYAHTPEQVQTQIEQNYFAAQQAKPVAKDANRGLNHVDILSYMLGRPVATAG